MGSFQYIAFIDVDEVIAPRVAINTIPQLIKNLTARVRVGKFVFRNTHFFLDLEDERNETYVTLAEHLASLSVYLTRYGRANVSPWTYVIKCIVNTDACLSVWVHSCHQFTSQFKKATNHILPRLNAELAQKHHYRIKRIFDERPDIYKVVIGLPSRLERGSQPFWTTSWRSTATINLTMQLLKRYKELELV
jgi:Glycosyltransferase family 92